MNVTETSGFRGDNGELLAAILATLVVKVSPCLELRGD